MTEQRQTAKLCFGHRPARSIRAESARCLRATLPTSGILAAVLLSAGMLTTPLFSSNTLSERSPFLPPGHGVKKEEPAQPAVQPQGPIARELEFRGVAQFRGEFQFSIFNKKDQKSYWIVEDKDSESGISVRNYDPKTSTIVVNLNGRSERLSMSEQTDSPIPVTQAPPSTPERGNTAVLPPELQNNTTNTNRREVPKRRILTVPKKK